MNALGLSDAQLAERKLRLHAGDATAIMAGDYRKVFRRIKGLDADDDLSGEFRVQLGSFTEPFNLRWTVRQTGRMVDYYSANRLMQICWDTLLDSDGLGGTYAFHQELAVHPRHKWMACNLDGMTTTPQGNPCPIDAKHVGSAGEQAVLRYTPAGVWQATVTGCDWWALSFIVGNKWVEPDYQPVDPWYQAEMVERAEKCWGYIERGEEPPEPEGPPVLAPKPQPKRRSIDVPLNPDDPVFGALMQRENWLSEMVEAMGAFATTHAAAARHAIARKRIADVLPEDVGRVTRGRIKATRDGRGVTISLEKEPSDAEDRG